MLSEAKRFSRLSRLANAKQDGIDVYFEGSGSKATGRVSELGDMPIFVLVEELFKVALRPEDRDLSVVVWLGRIGRPV